MSPSAESRTRPQLVTQAGSPDHRTNPDHQPGLPAVVLRFPADAAVKLARTPVVHDLLEPNITLPGAPTIEERRLDCHHATDFVSRCCRDQRLFSSPEQAAHALLTQHRSVAASLALAHAVIDLLESAPEISTSAS